MSDKKKLAVVLAVLAVVAVFAALVFSGVIDFSSGVSSEPSTSEGKSYSDDYASGAKSVGQQSQPYFKTEIDGVYYTVSTQGEVKFYSYENAVFSPVEATGTYETSVVMSEETVSVTVTYIQRDGVISGYGLHTAQDGDTTLYPYAFFRLRNYGENYDNAYSTSALLLVDTTQEDFYSADKLYEECYIFAYADSSATRALSEASRTVGLNGAKREDYFLMNDSVIDASTSHMLFFSGRKYAQDDGRLDLYRSGGSGNNVDNISVAENVLARTVYRDGDTLKFVCMGDDGTVSLCAYDGDETSVVEALDAAKGGEVIGCGDYLYFSASDTLYSLKDGSSLTLDCGDEAFTADLLAVGEDTAVLRGYTDAPMLAFVSLSDGKATKTLKNDDFSLAVNAQVLPDGSFMLDMLQGEAFKTCIF